MDAFYGEIRAFGFNFPPQDWATCQGQQLQVMQNQVLFAVIGAAFGGNGQSTFNLPNLMVTTPGGTGSGPGLTPRSIGNFAGDLAVTLSYGQMPSHTHDVVAGIGPVANRVSAPAGNTAPSIVTQKPSTNLASFSTNAPDTQMSPQVIGVSGGGQSHPNTQPFQAMPMCICTYGNWPERP